MDEWDTEPDYTATEEERLFACSIHPELYPGVHGEVVVREQGDLKITFVNYIWALNEGSGQVGKYLDSLEGTVIFEAVLSKRLRGMLKRRGYKPYGISIGMCKGI